MESSNSIEFRQNNNYYENIKNSQKTSQSFGRQFIQIVSEFFSKVIAAINNLFNKIFGKKETAPITSTVKPPVSNVPSTDTISIFEKVKKEMLDIPQSQPECFKDCRSFKSEVEVVENGKRQVYAESFSSVDGSAIPESKYSEEISFLLGALSVWRQKDEIEINRWKIDFTNSQNSLSRVTSIISKEGPQMLSVKLGGKPADQKKEEPNVSEKKPGDDVVPLWPFFGKKKASKPSNIFSSGSASTTVAIENLKKELLDVPQSLHEPFKNYKSFRVELNMIVNGLPHRTGVTFSGKDGNVMTDSEFSEKVHCFVDGMKSLFDKNGKVTECSWNIHFTNTKNELIHITRVYSKGIDACTHHSNSSGSVGTS